MTGHDTVFISRCKSMADAAKFGFGDIRCHQMSPDVRILTEKQVVILLFKADVETKFDQKKPLFV